MNYTIRRGPLVSRAVRLSLAVIVWASVQCAQAHEDGDDDLLPLPEDASPVEVTQAAPAGQALAVTDYSSRPGAPYTVYLDFGGFTFNGGWGGGAAPGTTPAYTVDGDASTFNPTELANIQQVWSRVAEKYSAFNINVTTVDPAIAAGQAGSDSQRQTYYDTTARVMHTVIGGLGNWFGGGGVSYVGVTANSYSGMGSYNGYHTNWVFAAHAPSNLQFVAEASAHENGHGLYLYHQSDFNGSTLINEYSLGTGTGPGSKAPTMGNSYTAERGLWKIGTADIGGPSNQNDLATIMSSNFGLGPFINDGIGHSLGSATPLPMNGQTVNYNLAKGIIVPSSSNPTSTSGAAKYLSDYWSFSTGDGPMSLSVIAGRESITPGIADPGPTLDASLEILDTSGTVLYSSATSSLSETLAVSLAPGNYIAHVMSAADPFGSNFYDIGSYFLTGTVAAAVPEPSTMALLMACAAFAGIGRRKWRRRSRV